MAAALSSTEAVGAVARSGADQAAGLRTAMEAAKGAASASAVPAYAPPSPQPRQSQRQPLPQSYPPPAAFASSPAPPQPFVRAEAPPPSVAFANSATSPLRQPARVIAITSGKGGVGKTNVAVNLAIALSQKGARTVVIDADFGLANVEVLFGSAPQSRLQDILSLGRPLPEALNDGPAGVKYISGGSGVEEAALAFAEQASALVAWLSVIDREFDIVIIDTGAGISDSVVDMALAADDIILVATPEPTSITDAYSLVKTLSSRDRQKPLHLLLNRAENRAEASDVTARFLDVTSRFLDLRIGKLGYILSDPLVVRSVKAQFPFILGYPRSAPANSVRDVADRLLERRAYADAPKGRGITGFLAVFSRLSNLQYK